MFLIRNRLGGVLTQQKIEWQKLAQQKWGGEKLGARKNRPGYTLLEILVATTLTLILMYAIAAIFSQVGGLMSQTQNVMGMSNSLRSTRDRLVADLESLTVPKLKAPTSQYGYFCYVEGLGGDWARVLNNGSVFSIDDIARDTENGGVDTTVGDTDDILSFTAKAPEGEWFRGRFVNIISGSPEIVESEYAEIVWFLRGTTLYRRVLLIVPDDKLQESLNAFGNPAVAAGYGFFSRYDISVRLDPPATPSNPTPAQRVVANTLSDLGNRKNRYGVWTSLVEAFDRKVVSNPLDLGQHGIGQYKLDRYEPDWPGPGYDQSGGNGAWYWLRMPTLQESATIAPTPMDSFRAGGPFGFSLSSSGWWLGTNQGLTPKNIPFPPLDANPPSPPISSQNLPFDRKPPRDPNGIRYPFFDFWREPNPWVETDPDSGDLDLAIFPNRISPTNPGVPADTYTQDVILTNVLSFNVRAWDETAQSYIDLGGNPDNAFVNGLQYRDGPSNTRDELQALSASSFGNFGWYQAMGTLVPGYTNGATPASPPATATVPPSPGVVYPFMPAVFDTWTADYEKEHLMSPISDGTNMGIGVSRRPGFTVDKIPLDGKVTPADLPDFPPPYTPELKGIQIELRVFDPVSRAIKNVTCSVDFVHR